MLPDCLAAHLCGKLEEVERVVRAAEQATSRECAANTLRTDAIKLPGALRWVGRRVRGVQLFLSLIISLYPVKFGGLEPTVVVFHFVSTKFFRLFRCKAEEFCGLIHYCRKELQ